MSAPALAPLDQPSRRWLLAVAAPSEARAIGTRLAMGAPGSRTVAPDAYWQAQEINDRISLVLTGVGKANASGAVACAFDPMRHAGVISIGIAGCLPGSGLAPLESVLASSSVFADEGSQNPGGFIDISAMGFAPNLGIATQVAGMAITPADSLPPLLAPLCTRSGVIATVSTCAGSDARAVEVVRRTRAIAEAMEGAAAGLAVARLTEGVGLFAEVRIISNTTGDRERQTWRLRESLERLGELAALL